jgi:hypothetical protein
VNNRYHCVAIHAVDVVGSRMAERASPRSHGDAAATRGMQTAADLLAVNQAPAL